MTQHHEAIVIGAGLGGLAAATTMVNEGLDVLLLERHNVPGGYATSFVRGRFEFEVALHELEAEASESPSGAGRGHHHRGPGPEGGDGRTDLQHGNRSGPEGDHEPGHHGQGMIDLHGIAVHSTEIVLYHPIQNLQIG